MASPDSNEGVDTALSNVMDIQTPLSLSTPSGSSFPGDSSEDNPLTLMPRVHQDILRTLMVLQEKFEFPDEQEIKQATVRTFVVLLMLLSEDSRLMLVRKVHQDILKTAVMALQEKFDSRASRTSKTLQ